MKANMVLVSVLVFLSVSWPLASSRVVVVDRTARNLWSSGFLEYLLSQARSFSPPPPRQPSLQSPPVRPSPLEVPPLTQKDTLANPPTPASEAEMLPQIHGEAEPESDDHLIDPELPAMDGYTPGRLSQDGPGNEEEEEEDPQPSSHRPNVVLSGRSAIVSDSQRLADPAGSEEEAQELRFARMGHNNVKRMDMTGMEISMTNMTGMGNGPNNMGKMNTSGGMGNGMDNMGMMNMSGMGMGMMNMSGMGMGMMNMSGMGMMNMSNMGMGMMNMSNMGNGMMNKGGMGMGMMNMSNMGNGMMNMGGKTKGIMARAMTKNMKRMGKAMRKVGRQMTRQRSKDLKRQNRTKRAAAPAPDITKEGEKKKEEKGRRPILLGYENKDNGILEPERLKPLPTRKSQNDNIGESKMMESLLARKGNNANNIGESKMMESRDPLPGKSSKMRSSMMKEKKRADSRNPPLSTKAAAAAAADVKKMPMKDMFDNLLNSLEKKTTTFETIHDLFWNDLHDPRPRDAEDDVIDDDMDSHTTGDEGEPTAQDSESRKLTTDEGESLPLPDDLRYMLVM